MRLVEDFEKSSGDGEGDPNSDEFMGLTIVR